MSTTDDTPNLIPPTMKDDAQVVRRIPSQWLSKIHNKEELEERFTSTVKKIEDEVKKIGDVGKQKDVREQISQAVEDVKKVEKYYENAKKVSTCFSRHVNYIKNLRHDQVVWAIEMLILGGLMLFFFLNFITNIWILNTVDVIHHVLPILSHCPSIIPPYNQSHVNSTDLSVFHVLSTIHNKTWL